MSGTVVPCRHADFRFPARAVSQGWRLLCCHRATSDLRLETHEAGSAAEIPAQRIEARVSRLELLQDSIAQLTVRTPRSAGLHFLAGQAVSLAFDGLSPKLLPIASCPCDGIQLRFHVRRLYEPFSDFVFNGLRKGQDVALQGPCGDFTLDENSERPLVFIAWETGFAPISSLIDHAIQKDINRSIDLYWLSGFPDGHYLPNYCRAWRDILDDFRYQPIDLTPVGDDQIGDVIDRAIRVHSLLADHDYYLALPDQALEPARQILDAANVPIEQVRFLSLAHP